MSRIVILNAGLKYSVKTNKHISVKAISMASYLIEECPKKRETESANGIFMELKKGQCKPRTSYSMGVYLFL